MNETEIETNAKISECKVFRKHLSRRNDNDIFGFWGSPYRSLQCIITQAKCWGWHIVRMQYVCAFIVLWLQVYAGVFFFINCSTFYCLFHCYFCFFIQVRLYLFWSYYFTNRQVSDVVSHGFIFIVFHFKLNELFYRFSLAMRDKIMMIVAIFLFIFISLVSILWKKTLQNQMKQKKTKNKPSSNGFSQRNINRHTDRMVYSRLHLKYDLIMKFYHIPIILVHLLLL